MKRNYFDDDSSQSIAGLVLAIMVLVFIFFGIYYLASEIESKRDAMKANVGKKIVIGNDTLLIVDYSYVFESYTLSNGTEVSETFVENNPPLK